MNDLDLTVIPIREIVAFPSTVVPFLIGRQKSIEALKFALEHTDGMIFLAVQRDQLDENPSLKSLYRVGLIAKIVKHIKQDSGNYRVMIKGLERAKLLSSYENSDGLELVQLDILEEIRDRKKEELQLSIKLQSMFENYISKRAVNFKDGFKKIGTDDLSAVTDIIISVINVSIRVKQSLLKELNVYNRAIKVYDILGKGSLNVIRNKKKQIFENDDPDYDENEVENYKKKISEKNFPDNIKKYADIELNKLSKMPLYSAESSVSRNYMDWLLDIPWTEIDKKKIDIKKARQILDEDHYGLFKVKDRILDYIAVLSHSKKPLGEIICFVGPPGVGKSSLSKSIARALGRKFTRVSLGGVKDEAEIRGHRRTYIGAYPGQIVKGLKKAKTINPVFLLDEIDKLNSDFKGDPASALLEVLDPEQNMEFIDHFIDIEMDLSKIFFITTANSLSNISYALRDRMEIIELSGYTEKEKLEIAKKYLIKKQAEKNGLNYREVLIKDELLLKIIHEYTREAGVRELERVISIVLRKITRHIVEDKQQYTKLKPFVFDENLIIKYLGAPKYGSQKLVTTGEIGVSVGLAWTQVGGDILLIEARLLKGKGKLIMTGRLGEVMQESLSTAFTYSKLKLAGLGFDTAELDNYDIHLHIPEGAVPKEGPSAGVTLAISIISLITGIPVRDKFAMTGEITLRGKVLAVGGIKEKVLAAHRYGMKNILIPIENKKDYGEDIPEDIKDDIKIYFIDNMNELLDIALENKLVLKNINSKVLKLSVPVGVQ
jgi:ATP-dependent Lon protease